MLFLLAGAAIFLVALVVFLAGRGGRRESCWDGVGTIYHLCLDVFARQSVADLKTHCVMTG